tara:strand:- start:3889 stop:4161 length:273 start_codon:yes stop_codon:yes gene_type:complete
MAVYINIKLYIKGIPTQIYVNSDNQWYLDFDFNKALEAETDDDYIDDLCQCLESRMQVRFDRYTVFGEEKYDIIDIDVESDGQPPTDRSY